MNLRGKALALLTASGGIATGLIASLEGYSPEPYYDVAGILTDCYGNTYQVSKARVRTKQECTKLLNNEVSKLSYRLLQDYPNHTVNSLASLTSFTYNVGYGAYSNSTLRKKLKRGDLEGACREMYKWVYITKNGYKVKSKGLMNRRKQEVELCLTP